jgi:hypothetical protein
MFGNKFQMILGSVLMLAGGLAANAQITGSNSIKVTLDHPFVVKDKTLPAGKYIISTLGEMGSPSDVLKIQSVDGKQYATFQTIDAELNVPAKDTALIFDRVGDEYILSKIVMKGDTEAAEITPTRSEKAVETETGQN